MTSAMWWSSCSQALRTGTARPVATLLTAATRRATLCEITQAREKHKRQTLGCLPNLASKNSARKNSAHAVWWLILSCLRYVRHLARLLIDAVAMLYAVYVHVVRGKILHLGLTPLMSRGCRRPLPLERSF